MILSSYVANHFRNSIFSALGINCYFRVENLTNSGGNMDELDVAMMIIKVSGAVLGLGLAGFIYLSFLGKL